MGAGFEETQEELRDMEEKNGKTGARESRGHPFSFVQHPLRR